VVAHTHLVALATQHWQQVLGNQCTRLQGKPSRLQLHAAVHAQLLLPAFNHPKQQQHVGLLMPPHRMYVNCLILQYLFGPCAPSTHGPNRGAHEHAAGLAVAAAMQTRDPAPAHCCCCCCRQQLGTLQGVQLPLTMGLRCWVQTWMIRSVHLPITKGEVLKTSSLPTALVWCATQ
jgi:hypothetical protein